MRGKIKPRMLTEEEFRPVFEKIREIKFERWENRLDSVIISTHTDRYKVEIFSNFAFNGKRNSEVDERFNILSTVMLLYDDDCEIAFEALHPFLSGKKHSLAEYYDEMIEQFMMKHAFEKSQRINAEEKRKKTETDRLLKGIARKHF